MSLNINKNFGAIANNAATSMGLRQSAMGKAISRISTGKRVNGPSDDVSAYMTSRRIEADSTGYSALANGVQNASAKLNAVDAGISSVLDVLNAMKAKALEYQAAEDDGEAQSIINDDFKNLAKVLDSSLNFKYNNKSVLGSDGASVNVYATLYSDTKIGDEADLSKFAITAAISGISTAISGQMSNNPNMNSAGITDGKTIVSELSNAINEVVKKQADVAGAMGALEYANAFLQNAATAQDAAYSSITEVDMAREMTTYVKNNVLSQASQAMISQANQSMAQVLNLLQ